MKSFLVLENGKVFEGIRIGSNKDKIFNIVVNTGNTGYTEILTDPSLYGEGVVFTSNQVGNNKVNLEECESQGIYCTAAIFNSIADYNDIYVDSSDKNNVFASIMTIQEFLKRFDVPALTEIDVKAVVKEIKNSNVIKAAICTEVGDLEKTIEQIKSFNVSNTCSKISTETIKSYGRTKAKQVAIIDLGVKDSIVNEFLRRDIGVTIYPIKTQIELILATRPNGIVLPNGSGNPNEFEYMDVINKVNKTNLPILAIGMGSLLLALSNNLKVDRMSMSKIGQNYTVKDISKNKIVIVSQNNKYRIDPNSVMQTVESPSFIDCYDNSIMGIDYSDKKIISVLFNPEGSPGPKDSNYIFDDFIKMF